ncbi:MAG: helix-hairpin-helix domain-containing protein [Polyangiales bacterium]
MPSPLPSPSTRPSSPLLVLSLFVIVASLVGLARAWRRERPEPAWVETRAPVDGAQARALRDGRPLDLNRATAEELELLPRIGPALAARVVEARPFDTVDDLRRVRGIGARTLERLRPLVRVEDANGGDEPSGAGDAEGAR